MRKIFNENQIILQIIGKQKIDKDNYRLSSFCLKRKIDNKTLIYNNLTKQFLLLTNDEANLLKTTNIKYNPLLDELILNWVLVPIGYDELKLCDDLYNTLQCFENHKDITTYTILTTTACNARCFYCYEKGISTITMTDDIAHEVAKYITEKSARKSVYIKWFGGEPLCNQRSIDLICKFLTENNIKFECGMISNGYLLDETVISKAIENWNLKNIQITLDGTEKVYNETKNYKTTDNNSPFIKVINNIKSALKYNLKIKIRLNLTEKNSKDLWELVEWLNNDIVDKTGISIYCAPIYDFEHVRSDYETDLLLKNYISVEKKIFESGFSRCKLEEYNTFKRGCMADRDNAVVIAPNGNLSKCEHFTEGKNVCGSIYKEEINQEVISYWKSREVIEECRTCVGYPTCGGLSHCPYYTRKCELYEKRILQFRLETAMENDYNFWKDNMGENFAD